MRIAIGEFSHETNTFRPGLTGVSAFQAKQWESGEDVLTAHRGVRDSLGGMIAAAARLGIDLVPTIATTAEPSATIARAAYEEIRDRLFAGIRAAGDLDAICLSLHGAGTAEGIDDLEGTLLGELRAIVGNDIPIVVTLDLHGNLTPAMVEHADVLLNCHEYPHIDMYERGVEAIEIAVAMVRGALHPIMHLELLPMLLPPATTMGGPAQTINRACFAQEDRPGIIDCALAHGFPHTDVPMARTSVVATADGDPALAREAARAVARQVWEMREEFRDQLPGAAEAVRLALASPARPVVIAEVSDNPGGGAPGDGTHLLRALIEANAPDTCFGFIADPEVARQAHEAGVGSVIQVRLGGKTDDMHGEPIAADAYVKCLTDGLFRLTTPMGAGGLVDLGLMARLVIGNVDVLVASVRSQTFDDEVFRLHGIDVTRCKLVALKSTQHFRAGFAPLAGEIIRADPPGATTSNLAQQPYRRLSRSLWPLDDTVTWE
ncbi:MAG: M81 family metallopeptidase [Thermomicrobiales bacterium]